MRISLPLVLVIALAGAGCATMTVSSHVEPGLDISPYHSFNWGPADALPVQDSRLADNPFYKDHIQGEVERQLGARGFTLDTDKPDLLIHYHAVIDRRLDVDRVDQEHGYCFDDGCQARTFEYESGTLVIDVVDARSNKVIWRGWAQDTVERSLKNEDRLATQIEQSVRRMLARFPRPTEGGK